MRRKVPHKRLAASPGRALRWPKAPAQTQAGQGSRVTLGDAQRATPVESLFLVSIPKQHGHDHVFRRTCAVLTRDLEISRGRFDLGIDGRELSIAIRVVAALLGLLVGLAAYIS